MPIEVKSGVSGTLRSLHQFIHTKKPKLTLRFDGNLPSLTEYSNLVKVENEQAKIAYTMMSLPLYFVEEVTRLVREYREK